jgi:hypothetical protein
MVDEVQCKKFSNLSTAISNFERVLTQVVSLNSKFWNNIFNFCVTTAISQNGFPKSAGKNASTTNYRQRKICKVTVVWRNHALPPIRHCGKWIDYRYRTSLKIRTDVFLVRSEKTDRNGFVSSFSPPFTINNLESYDPINKR